MRLLSLSLLLALTACSVAPASSTTSADSVTAPAPVDEAAASQLVGTYAVQVELNTIQPVPAALQLIAGREIKAKGRIYLLSEIYRKNGALEISQKNCAVRSDKVAGAQLSVPDSTVQTAPTVVSALEVSDVDGALTIKRGPKTLVVGAKLVDPVNDALPVDPRADSRVVDVEGDGKPGATSRLSFGLLKGDIYFIQRSTNSFEATLGADGELSGIIIDKTEQVLLGGTGIAAGLASNRTPVIAVQDPDAPSTVRFVKLEAGADCKAASNERLFN